ncbi:hypothetical protein Bequi_06470 [Brachybacterium sp. JHP9]|uniref:DUF2207 domain-containing protein n=1 Tax=Brachybacterium equifaecis TaxID=2910770 RepID=A0ABT0QZS0_9MICO|nr:hypothetical protein [Brachybacterium equifaecis]MCL6423035.1 hypothetical protein [Brachybacterium equifaecis]
MCSTDLFDWIVAITGAVTAIVSLFLLAQGQRDRQKLRKAQERAQAEKVLFYFEPGGTSAPIDAPFWPGRFLIIINHGSEVILSVAVTFVANPSGENFSQFGSLKQLHHIRRRDIDDGMIVSPLKSLRVGVEVGYFPEPGVGGDFAIVEFTDSSGRRWRRRTDTFELELIRPGWENRRKPTVIQRVWQNSGWLGSQVHLFMQAWARRSFSRHPERVPTAVKITEWAWGHWPIGLNGDPWLLPSGEPESSTYDYGISEH